jgi:TIGR03009 family protein
MNTAVGWWTACALLAAAAPAAAQSQSRYAAQGQPPGAQAPAAAQPRSPSDGPSYASQPSRQGGSPPQYAPASPEALVPRDPTLERRPRGPSTLPAPFTLTPQEQAQVDWVLAKWEEYSTGVKTFECEFTRFEYDGVFGDGRKPRFVDKGEIRYAAPDKGMFRVKPPHEEHWICDGKSIFEYDFQKQQLVEHQLPPELQGKAIADGPLPFIFGAKADQIHNRYHVRLIQADNPQEQFWLEAYPKYQADAANLSRATLILKRDGMQPLAIETVLGNGKNKTVFVLEKQKVNARNLLDPFGVFDNNWLNPRLPAGWTKIVEPPPAMQAGQAPAAGAIR